MLAAVSDSLAASRDLLLRGRARESVCKCTYKRERERERVERVGVHVQVCTQTSNYRLAEGESGECSGGCRKHNSHTVLESKVLGSNTTHFCLSQHI